MAAFASKRQQARNERTLQDLIKTVPGNDRCADCAARNPGWASWSLGIFLCMRCAALHRKLGTHISKVKSLSMDKWDNEQVDNMKRMGNTESNRLFNPRNVQPNIPIDADEVDGALERFIRQKYEHKAFTTDSRPGTRQNTGSTSSVEDRPPPLPPKPGKRFGFGLRASSSTFPPSRNVTPPISPRLGGFPEESPPRVSKASRVFGSNVSGSGEGLESKLATLRDMGFPDERRNTTVLKGLNGNLDKTVEALIRLGEGGSSTARSGPPAPPEKPTASGITIDRTRHAPATVQSTNPFDQLDNESRNQQQALPTVPQLQTQQRTNMTSYSHPASPSNPYNPFLPQPQQVLYSQQALEQSFQNLQLSQQPPPQQQPLFPNRTGGFDNQSQPPQQTNPFQHSFTPPPVPQIPPQYNAFFQQQPPQQQFSQPQTAQSTGAGGNPFLRSSRSQIFTPTNPFEQQQHQNMNIPTTQGYQNSQSFSASHVQSANPFQHQASAQHMSQQQALQEAAFQPTQFQNHQQSFSPNSLLQFQPSNPYQPQHQSQPQQAQQPSPFQRDKSSILALYNYPHLAPTRADSVPSPLASSDPSAPPTQGLKQRSVTMPITSSTASAGPTPGSMNPFASTQSPSHAQIASPGVGNIANAGTTRHVSNESVDFAGLMGGRHSPDAFSGLSARFVR